MSTNSLSVYPKTGAETLQCAQEAIAELKEGIVLKAKCLRGLRVHVRGMCSCVSKAKCIRGCGWGTVAGVRMQLSDTNLYSVLMTLPYDFVSTRQIWHILRLYHRGHMVAAALETACESVAGDVRFIERRGTVGRDASLKSLLASAQLRFIGLRGGAHTAVCVSISTQPILPRFIFFAIGVRENSACWTMKSMPTAPRLRCLF